MHIGVLLVVWCYICCQNVRKCLRTGVFFPFYVGKRGYSLYSKRDGLPHSGTFVVAGVGVFHTTKTDVKPYNASGP